MENNNNDKNIEVKTTTEPSKVCKCCGRNLPLNAFGKQGTGYRKICISCSKAEKGASEKFKHIPSNELIQELRARGYRGDLKKIIVEEVKI